MGFWDYFILIVVAIGLVAAVYFSHRRKKSGKGCCGCCDGCSMCNKKDKK